MLGKTHIITTQTITLSAVHACQLSLNASVPILIGAYFGSITPDIDHEKSSIRQSLGVWSHLFKYMKHRNITHTIWIVLLLIIACVFAYFNHIPQFLFNLLCGFTFGYFAHLFEDSLSRAGIAWFYPFNKKRHNRKSMFYKLYYPTGGKVEYALYHLFLVAYLFLLYLSYNTWFG